MIGSFLVALLLSSTAMAQTPAPAVMTSFLGMNDTDPSVALNPAEAQSTLNVESGLSGLSIQKRPGYSRLQSLTISTGPVSGSYNFIDANGAQEQVVCQDHNCAKSVNGGAFSVFLSTAGGTCMPTRWSFAQQNGFLYGANDCRDQIFRYDGTTRSPLSITAPLAAVIELTKDRLVAADVSANPNGVYYSQSGTPSNFTTGLNSADPYTDVLGSQGDRVTALKYTLGRLFIFKTTSLTACILGDQYSSRCFPVSNTTGTGDPQSVVEVPGGFYFRGNDLNYWAYDGQELSIVSKKISNFVKTQNSGTTQSNTQTSQADWQAGTQYGPGTWNTTTTNGSIFPSSNTYYSGISSMTWAVLSLDSSTNVANYVDNFDNGSLTGAVSWTATQGAPYVNSDHLIAGSTKTLGGSSSLYTAVTDSTGTWSFVLKSTVPCSNIPLTMAEISVKASVTDLNLDGFRAYNLFIANNQVALSVQPGSTLGAYTFPEGNICDGVERNFRISIATNGFITVGYQGVNVITATDVSISTGGYVVVRMLDDSGLNNIDYSPMSGVGKFKFPKFYTNQVTTAFDTGFSTPTFGYYSVSLTSASSSSVTFRTETSANGTSSWSGLASVANGAVPSSTPREFIRQNILVAAPEAAASAMTFQTVLPYATTGQFVTQCIQPGAAITGWGLLSCAQTLSSGGSEVFYATSAVSCAALPSAAPLTAAGSTQLGWTAQTNNSALSISTNAAVYIGWRSLLTATTDQAQVDACTLYWNNGVTAPPVWATFDSVRNAVYWTTAINNSVSNNRVLKYDLNLNQWYPFSLNANAIRNINNQTYFGDSTGGFWNQYGGVTSDNGTAINSYWKSKDFGNATNPFLDNNYTKLSLVTKNQVTGNMTVTLTPSNGQSSSYTVSLATTSAQVYVHSNQNLPFMSPLQFMNVQFGNNSATPWEVDGAMLEMTSFPWKPQNP